MRALLVYEHEKPDGLLNMMLSCRDVTKAYADKTVLDGVSIDVEAGQYFGLVGMNGSGKSTLIKAMLDLVSIDSGSISIMDRSHRSVNAREQVVYLPDRFSPPSHLRCKDFLEYMLQLHGRRYDDDEVMTMLESLDLRRDVMLMSVGKLSKGMTQKLGLASCLLSGKKFMVLDEPMSGLDPKSRVLFKRCLSEQKDKGMTLFFSSHVLADVEEMSDTMAVLHRSKIIYTGTTQSFVDQHTGDNLEHAYMNSIAEA